MTTEKVSLGMDIGGTGMRAALVDQGGQFRSDFVDVERDADTLVHIAKVTQQLRDEASKSGLAIERVGIGLAGIVDPTTEILISSPTMVSMEGLNFRKEIQEITGIMTVINNDANSAGYAEWMFGAGKGSQNCVSLFIGTGIGGAIVLDGRLFVGKDGVAGEIGHMILDPNGPECPCGARGCLEQLASGTAIERYVTTKLSEGHPSLLLQSFLEGKKISGKEIAEAAKKGDQLAVEAYEEAAKWLGIGISTLSNLLNMEVAVVGGGVMAVSQLLMPTILDMVDKYTMKVQKKTLTVKRNELGREAGTIGAALLALSQK